MSARATATSSMRERDPERLALTGCARPQLSQAVTHEEIAKLAYSLWQRRGCPVGSPQVDWFEAEAIVRHLHRGPVREGF